MVLVWTVLCGRPSGASSGRMWLNSGQNWKCDMYSSQSQSDAAQHGCGYSRYFYSSVICDA